MVSLCLICRRKCGAMLFDEEKDPRELKNVADDPKNAAIRAELSKLVKGYWADFKPVN